MCFVVDSNHKEPKIVEEDIVCYKIFNDEIDQKYFTSLCQSHRYEKGVRFDDAHVPEPCGNYIEEGIHSYAKPAVENPEYLDGNHNGWVYSVQVKCIIPKGTTYYLNEVYDNATNTPNLATYVSESIIIGTDEDIISGKQ